MVSGFLRLMMIFFAEKIAYLSEISIMKQEIEELILNADGTQRTTKINDYRSGKIPL